jgi:hypothetical protein
MKAGFQVQKKVKFYYVITVENQVVLSDEHVGSPIIVQPSNRISDN